MRCYLMILITISTFIFAQTDGEVVKNVSGAQRTDGSKILDIYYDLEESDTFSSYNIYVQLEWPGVDHVFYLENCGGDIWYDVQPGQGKYITCQLGEGVEDQFLSGEFYINIIAQSTAASENPFEMVTINASQQTDFFNYDYEMMKTQVTAAEYVQFLNDFLGTATNIDNQDEDYWTDIEGGEIYLRIYEFDNYVLTLYYDVNAQVGHISEDEELGYESIMPIPPGQIGNVNHSNILTLRKVNDDDEYAKIQFSSTAAGAEDFSFFISPGKGNDPIVDVGIAGADLFARYYGLRIPTMKEYKLPIWNELNADGYINDILQGYIDIELFFNLPPSLEFYWQNTSSYAEWNEPYNNLFDGTYAVDEGYEYSIGLVSLLSNGTEFMYSMIPNTPNDGYPDYIDYYTIIKTRGFTASYGNNFALGPFGNGDLSEMTGFRCARTIPGSYTGNNE